MQIRTSQGDALQFIANSAPLPGELRLPGAQSFHAHHASGDYYYQHLPTDQYQVFKSVYVTTTPVALQVQTDQPWLGFRLVLQDAIRHFLGGVQEVLLQQGQFNFAYQPQVNDWLLLEPGHRYVVFDLLIHESLLAALSVDRALRDTLAWHVAHQQPYLLLPRYGWSGAAVLDALEDFEQCPQAPAVAGKLIRRLLRAARQTAPGPALSTRTIEGLFRARDTIRANLQQHLTVRQLARAAHLNEFSFKQAFRQVFQTSPYQYLKHHRLRTAKRLLLTTRETLQSIAEQAGYHHATNLIVAFRKAFQLSPTQWRNSRSVT